MNKQLSGFSKSYYLTESGSVFDTSKNKYVHFDERHRFWLRQEDEITRVRVSLKDLYRQAYGKEFCIDNIMDLEGEIWKPVARTEERYLVSNLGRVKSLTGYYARILKPNTPHGYEQVDIMYDNERFTRSVHRLVAYAFLGIPEDPEMELHHINGCKNDNRVENLIWLTPQEHRKAHMVLKERNKDEQRSNEEQTNKS